ncbi:MAG: hypothetical protein A2269_06360 [Lentisphaerae bacterium RIFOXYA12_FULL_60_10]|nr:MAG: hypothetical protein A2269_06360 [Lentisphaerae bacterium RIFOXYA12_FULL_60_10]
MRKIAAITILTLRTAIRSRLVAALIVILLIAAVILPGAVRGDGTLPGQVRMAIAYTLGVTRILLSMAALWAAAGAIALEVEDRQIHMVMTKPITAFQVWTGKWLGLLFIHAGMLTIVGILLYAGLMWTLHRSASPAEQDLLREHLYTSRLRIVPEEPDLTTEIQARFNALRQATDGDTSLPDDTLLANLANSIRAERLVVAPGQSRQWILHVPGCQSTVDSRVITLRYRFVSSFRDRLPVTGTWWIGNPAEPRLGSIPVDEKPEGVHRLDIPASARSSSTPWVLTFDNETRDKSNTVVFDFNRGIELLIEDGTMGANLFRGLWIILAQLALLTAVGITVSTGFSMPVTSFITTALLCICLLSRWAADDSLTVSGDHHGTSSPPPEIVPILTETGEWIINRVAHATNPLFAVSPSNRLADGIRITWAETGHSTLWMLLIYPAILAAIGHIILRRRELALPTT